MSVLSKFLVFSILFLLSFEILSLRRSSSRADDHLEDLNDHTFRIVGGYRPEHHTLVKHVISLRTRYQRKYFGDNHICGGAIISPRYILTAAHCLRNSISSLRVVTGTPNRLKATSTTRVFKVIAIIIHPRYNAILQTVNDIGILKLNRDIIEDGISTQRIQLADNAPQVDTICTVVGWGSILFHGPLSDDAVYINLKIWSPEDCNAIVYGWQPGMMCAREPTHYGEDTCTGDSGGPLICKNEVAGVVSFGFSCGIYGLPAIYSNVSHYRSWIDRNYISSSVSIWRKDFYTLISFGIILIDN